MREILEMSVFKVCPSEGFVLSSCDYCCDYEGIIGSAFHFSTAPPHTVSHQYKFNKCNYKTFFKRHVLERICFHLLGWYNLQAQNRKLCSLSKGTFVCFLYFRWNYLIFYPDKHITCTDIVMSHLLVIY